MGIERHPGGEGVLRQGEVFLDGREVVGLLVFLPFVEGEKKWVEMEYRKGVSYPKPRLFCHPRR